MDALGEWLAQNRAARMPSYEAGNAEQPNLFERAAKPLGTALGAGIGFIASGGNPAGAMLGASIGGGLGDAASGISAHDMTLGRGIMDAASIAAPMFKPVPSTGIAAGPGTVPALPDPTFAAPSPFLTFQTGGVVPPQTFTPLSSDPAMRAALGIVDPPQQSNGSRLVDALAEALGSVNYSSLLGPRSTGGQRTLAALGTLGGRTFKNYREGLADDRKAVAEKNANAMKMLNEADINAALQQRRTAAKAELPEDKSEWQTVPAEWAHVTGRSDLLGVPVHPKTYAALKDGFEVYKANQQPITSNLTPDQAFAVQKNARNYSRRMQQVADKIVSLKKDVAAGLGGEDAKAKIETLTATLADLDQQWTAADDAVFSGVTSKAARGSTSLMGTPATVTNISPKALSQAAGLYVVTGKLPGLGIGGQAGEDKKKIMNMAAELFPSVDIAQNSATFGANKTSLAAIQKLYDSATAFETTALKNAEVLKGTLKGLFDSGSPAVNGPVRALNKDVLGDTNMAAFSTAIETVKPEFARLLSSPGASGMLTDTARKEMEAVLSNRATVPQLLRSIDVLTQDAENRRSAYQTALDTIRGRLTAETPGQASEKIRVRRKSDGKTGTLDPQDFDPAKYERVQ